MKLIASNQVPKILEINFILIFTIHFLLSNHNVCATPEDDAIKKWADDFGNELWELGKNVTKFPEIKAKYKECNVTVEQKDGEALIESIVTNVGRMLTRKIDAVRCILYKAENLSIEYKYNATYAENEFKYYNSIYSSFYSHPTINISMLNSSTTNISLSATLKKYKYKMHKDLEINEGSHFSNLSLNANYSSVHVPVNIDDRNYECNATNALSEFKYYKNQYSSLNSQPTTNISILKTPTTNISMFAALRKYKYTHKDLEVNVDSHFFNLSLNTNHSSVHVPAKIDDRNRTENLSIEYDYNSTNDPNEFQYFKSKYTIFNAEPTTNILILKTATSNISVFKTLKEYKYMYKDLELNEDSHFFNLSVNTNYSSVHVPANIFDRNPEVLKAIMWSEKLDDVFKQNYQSDPALSWQYFCSDTGILRHYPAFQWKNDSKTKTDTFDCRKRSWYIETVTCSKDIVILMDNSGSMRGLRNRMAKFTINEIMNTFSNNDYFTIFNYSKTTDDIIDCFKDTLVQATPENIQVFYDAISHLEPEGYANSTIALTRAFELLKKYYIERRCNESTVGCNQAIMLVTDGIPGNFTEIYQQYNWDSPDNSTKGMRVRIFTYLLGKEVTKVREAQWMACLNRGYYSHVQTLDKVQGEVLKYVDVIATPLVLQNEEHPPTWTHAFADRTYKPQSDGDEDVQNDEEPILLIAVGVPLFNRNYLKKNATNLQARLLGVAGTDIPVEDIDKITLPYKLGVNGYSFVISNNGYVLLHPDLRPSYIHEDEYDLDHPKQKRLKNNYNSIDLVEIEQINDDFVDDPREINEEILEIRRNMVNFETGKNLDVQIKLHYDKMRRVSEEEQDYFYAPIPETPFSLGLVLPSKYGKTWIKVGEESKMNINKGINIADYFIGDNWKVHPDWVYCKYHYLEGHEFETPESELKHFLGKIIEENWEWYEQYEKDDSEDSVKNGSLHCGRKSLDDDAYYCNKELVEMLIFDANVTNSSYGAWKFTDEKEKALIKMYNATLRFVATMSGLTRWQFIFGEVEVKGDKEFGDFHTLAIDETWYKSAILQHAIDPDSFIYSVPHASDPEEDSDLKVTASHAIFLKDGELEAPGNVVGFQFSHNLMYQRFAAITSKVECGNCTKTCATDDHECFVIDNNGYIILSESVNDSGKFFGEVEGSVMEAMVEFGIYKEVVVYDFQAVCREVKPKTSECSKIVNPITILGYTINWLVTELIWYWSKINYMVQSIPFRDDIPIHHTPNHYTTAYWDGDEQEYIKPKKPEISYRPCDKESHLYILQQQDLMDTSKYNTALEKNYSRPFHIKRIPKSNLLLVVVKMLYNQEPRKPTTEPKEILYKKPFPCYKLNLSFLERRRLTECYTYHENEKLYTYCGRATLKEGNVFLTIFSTIIFVSLSILWQS